MTLIYGQTGGLGECGVGRVGWGEWGGELGRVSFRFQA